MNSESLVRSSLEKIEEIDQSGYKLNSVLALSESAITDSEAFDRNGKDLPLQGLPILIKDNIEALGLPATAGSTALLNTPVIKDSTIASRLRNAGAIIIGATNLSEWANIRSTKSTSGWSAVGGLTANPWLHGRSAGGSSSGSGAAVAAGLTQWAIGSETDGSIICPASLNGCVGIKPTGGSIPRDGMIPISSSQDTPGPMTQTVSQAALLLDVLTEKNEYLALANQKNSLTVGVVKQWISDDTKIAQLFEDSIKKLESSGFKIVEVELTPPADKDHEDELFVLLYELAEGLRKYLPGRKNARISNLREIVNFNLENSEVELKHFGQELFDLALEYEFKNSEYQEARKRNFAWAEKTLSEGLSSVDVLIGCTYGTAWESNLETGDKYEGATWITTAPAIAGTPIGTIPMGLVDGLPIGLGFVSGRNAENKLISAMSQAEKSLNIGVMSPSFTK
jgi:amidase